jgi:two-component system chemotaxis response regulator CheB
MPDYKLIVIGVSLGGLNALRVILKELPAGFPLPIAVVQHRMKDADLMLAELLREHCCLSVVSVIDKDEIKPGSVYIAPSNYHMLIEDGYFALSAGAPVYYARPSIDVLFESAADVYGNKVIGVILTGSNQDGANGMAAIKKRGGLTVAEDPATAENGIMPASAIAAAKIDYILPLEEIGSFLAKISIKKVKKVRRRQYVSKTKDFDRR